jgi:F-type H+-transporting ATPase subunit gamma
VPNLKDIKRRISTVAKTQQITSAMRMVAAAKLRRAESAIKAARPYAERMRDTLGEVAAGGGDADHPLLQQHEVNDTLELVVITSDRGLAAAFNSNAIKRGEAVIADRTATVKRLVITPIGRKASEHFRKHYPKQVEQAYEIGAGWIEYSWAAEIAQRLASRYEAGEIDEVALVYNRFESVMTQTPVAAPLLPFAPPAAEVTEDGVEKSPYEFEPNAKVLLQTLAPRALEVEVYRAALENQAGEHAARMTAMESATRNTEDLIESLTLQYNRARQAAITKELVEIVSGAQALE